MEKTIEIKATGNEVRVFEGILPSPVNFKTQAISGTIEAPSEFFKKRHLVLSESKESSDSLNYNYDASYVEFDYSNNTIQLILNAAHPGQISVLGTFIVNKVFAELKINSTDSYSSPAELLAVVRHKSNIFKSVEEHKETLKSLRNFTMSITREHKEWSDQNGRAGKSESFALKNPHVLGFDLYVPIFAGESKLVVKVEVEIEIRNNNPEFFLISTELPVLMESYKEQRFSELIEDFSEIAIIKK